MAWPNIHCRPAVYLLQTGLAVSNVLHDMLAIVCSLKLISTLFTNNNVALTLLADLGLTAFAVYEF